MTMVLEDDQAKSGNTPPQPPSLSSLSQTQQPMHRTALTHPKPHSPPPLPHGIHHHYPSSPSRVPATVPPSVISPRGTARSRVVASSSATGSPLHHATLASTGSPRQILTVSSTHPPSATIQHIHPPPQHQQQQQQHIHVGEHEVKGEITNNIDDDNHFNNGKNGEDHDNDNDNDHDNDNMSRSSEGNWGPSAPLGSLQTLSPRRDHLSLMNSQPQDPFDLLEDHACVPGSIVPNVLLAVLDDLVDEVWFVTFSSDGTYLAGAAKDGTVAVWQIALTNALKSELIFVVQGHTQSVSCISFSPHGNMLLSCGADNRVCLWDTKSGHLIQAYNYHTDAVTCVGWLPNSRQFVTGSIDKSLVLMDIDEGEQHRWQGVPIHDLCVSPDGKFVAALPFEKHLVLVDLVNLNDTPVRIVCEDLMTSVHMGSDLDLVVVNTAHGDRGEVQVIDIKQKKIVKRLTGFVQRKFVIRSRFGGPGDAYVASGSEDSNVCVWSHKSGEQIETLEGHAGSVNCVSWSPDGLLASGSDDNSIRVWGTAQHMRALT
eukprot:c13122_g4_i1.p1 GENE.c13122_g4_i1~~c13122_g4_i1.p1  ORF type:complete len:541 (+),score=105.59 c13122_g4_i1:1073-2695(+)